MSQTPITLDPEELEALIRRIVREELSALGGASPESILDDWRQEGPDDPAQDRLLLDDALKTLRQVEERPEILEDLGELRDELARAEARGELPD